MDNNTWKLTPSHNKKAIGCKWVFKLKFHSNGTIERYKARIIAKGFNQTEDIDYSETFSLIVNMTTIWTLLSIDANKWFLHLLDINIVFLNGDLDEEVYMKPPSGLLTNSKKIVCRLNKSIYGLKQAS